MTRTEQLDKAKKLLELARRGVGGEMENAKRMLEQFKTKYNITEADLNGHTYSDSFRKYKKSDKEFMDELSPLIGLAILLFGIYLKEKMKEKRK